jgi:hypothetical protein
MKYKTTYRCGSHIEQLWDKLNAKNVMYQHFRENYKTTHICQHVYMHNFKQCLYKSEYRILIPIKSKTNN